ncbi:MAG: EamA family transporter [Ketobacter sp.]|nr:EamA family transporter [Ketobacter sp.]
MDWFWLALLCAFTLASADAATKLWLGEHRIGEITIIRLGLTGLLLSPALFLQPIPLLPPPFWLWIMLLIPLEILAMFLYTRAIRDHALSLTLPYLAFTPVFVTVTGWLILGETVNGRGLLGILLVVTGSWILNIEERKKSGWRSLIRQLRL